MLSWFRSHVASISATGVDFAVLTILTEIVGLWYVPSRAIGAVAGGTVSFLICRRWVFNRRDSHWHGQAFRYVLASGLSALLNTGGTWFVTETFGMHYLASSILVAVLVGVSVNFLMFRYFVFR